MPLADLLAVARGAEPADLLLSGGRLIDVFTGEILEADVAVAGGRIAGVGPGYRAHERIDLRGAYLCPGFIDAHVHVESSMVPPAEFAAAVVPRGVTTVVADPHEIASVLGLAGVRFMLDDATRAPLSLLVMAPSSVPATDLATCGASLDAETLSNLRRDGVVLGLAEVMDYPGVVAGVPRTLAKLEAFRGAPVDGHAPGLAGAALNAYAAAGIGSDHECTTADEARRKVSAGMTIFVREGSVAHDLDALLPAITPASAGRFCLCTDDCQMPDLVARGSIDHLVRRAIAAGLAPPAAIRLATLNPVEHYGLRDRGAIAPGRRADLLTFDDLRAPVPDRVWVEGRLVARGGASLHRPGPPLGAPSCGLRIDWPSVRFAVTARGRRMRVIGVVPGSLVTQALEADCPIRGEQVVAEPASDLLRMAVVERHRATGNVGLGFVRGIGLRGGAIASTVAHDHHNLIVIGADEMSMLTAAHAVAERGGGIAVAEGETVRAALALPVAGLMSDRRFEEVASDLEAAIGAARDLGSDLRDPFMTMSFLALEVIPALKLTDRGLVDVEAGRIVPLWLE